MVSILYFIKHVERMNNCYYEMVIIFLSSDLIQKIKEGCTFLAYSVDFFFLLNYDLTSGGLLGDGELEGMFMGTTTIFYALGQFLPSPIPVSTITENLILNGKEKSVRPGKFKI